MRLLAGLLALVVGCDRQVGSARPTTKLEEVDLGTLPATPFSLQTQVDVPADAISLTVVAEGDADALVSIEIVAPDDALLTQADDPFASDNPIFVSTRVTVAQVPIHPGVELLPGRYRMRALVNAADATVTLRAFIKRPLEEGLDVDAEGQVLALTLLHATDAIAPGDQDLDRAVDVAADIWAGADLDLVDVAAHVVGDLGPLTSDSPDFDRLLERSAGLADGAVPVFVVENLKSGAPQQNIAGLTATVPLPPMDGTPRSGIVLSASALREFPNEMGQILAHEIGHALGLFHTSERAGTEHDPLLDTARCEIDDDADKNGTVGIAECPGRGAENLMFWACCASLDPEISADQRFVVMRSALAR